MGLTMEHGGSYSRAGDGPRGCWYYLRYFFLFVSLIQFLIILGLVLFMVYGNVHVTTESNLRATERRADGLYNQVVELSAKQANLSKQLNLTTSTKDTIMQLLLNARRDLDRINASFRQCQGDLAVNIINQQYVAAIILSEKQCQEQLKKTNKTYEDLLLKLGEKAKVLEMELAKEKAICAKDKESLLVGKRLVDEQLAECGKLQEHHQHAKLVAEEQLRKVQALCLPLDKGKFEVDARNLWRDSIIPRTLDTFSYPYHPLGSELASIRRLCDHMPTLMTSKLEELARSLRAGIEHVARENTDLQSQKQELQRSLDAAREAKDKMEKEAQAREAKLQADCTRQMQLSLEEKAALRKERDSLAQELEVKKKEVEHLKMQLEVRVSALDTCLKAKSQPMALPRPVGPAPLPQPIDPTSLEEFKKRILESQRPLVVNPAVPPSG
uniref:Plasmalemma vesicle associated protein n=1 Tax=Jaculus jaculus TaxID=51337 RepID=A0A8C5JTL5_JACJA